MLNSTRCVFQLGAVPCEQKNTSTLLGQFNGKGFTKSFRCAGYEKSLSFERIHAPTSVGVESLSRFSTEFALLDHLDQQRCRCVLLRAEALVEDVHDVKHRVVAD